MIEILRLGEFDRRSREKHFEGRDTVVEISKPNVKLIEYFSIYRIFCGKGDETWCWNPMQTTASDFKSNIS